jgi:hypothetical protein
MVMELIQLAFSCVSMSLKILIEVKADIFAWGVDCCLSGVLFLTLNKYKTDKDRPIELNQ